MKLVKKLILTITILACCSAWALGQNTPNGGDSLLLTPDLKRILEAKNPNIFGPEYKGFIEKWQGNQFSDTQQKEIITSLINLEKMGMRARFDFKDFFESFNAAIDERSFDSGKIDKLTDAALKVSENYELKIARQYFSSLRLFLTDLSLKKDRNYGIYLENADFEIKYNGYDDGGSEEVIVASQPAVDINASMEELQAQAAASTVDDTPTLTAPFGPVIEFKRADLVFRSRLDTVVLRGMNANFTFEDKKITGLGGTIDWSNVGIPSQTAFATLDRYEFSVDQKVFDFIDVEFQYSGKIPAPIRGQLQIHGNPPRKTEDSYPRFVSNSADSPMMGLDASGLNYRGGISYQGAQFYSKSAYGDKSMLVGSWKGEKRFTAYSGSFTFNSEDSVVSTKNASVAVYHGKDSVFHPVVELEYKYGKGLLKLIPAKNGFTTTPFRTSFYNMDVVGDLLHWDLSQDTFNISTVSARNEIPVMVESKNYFNSNRFFSLAELYDFHPLLMAAGMAKRSGGDSFYLLELADVSGIGEGVLERTMNSLMSKGLAIYNPVTQLVTITEKGFHYVNANSKESDYDDLIIPSVTGESANTTFNTLNNVMTVRGVEQFFLSDSLDVIITPTNGEIRVLENRGIEFEGSLKAGNFQFLGRKFVFDYENFLVNLTEIDSIELQVEIEEGNRETLDNRLVQTSGILRINEPDNKSARDSKPEFPIFSSDKSATAFFNENGVLGGAYDSTVYFDVPPFKLDSAADADPSTFAFEGTFHADSIFPPFKENLIAMPDKSFGFIHAIPDSGYRMYKTSGRLFGELRLDQNGLTSPGVIKFLTATLTTEAVTFYLDSMYSEKGIEGVIEPGEMDGTSFPSTRFKRYEVNWRAKQDSMKIRNLEDPFELYDSLAKFEGTLTLSTKALMGDGDMSIQGSETESKAFTFKETEFEARNSLFVLKSNNPRKPILQSDDVRVSYDLSAQNASIQPEVQGNASIELPFAQYKTSIPEAQWDISNKIITMAKPDTVPIEKSFFYSTRKDQDSLVFSATNATYDIETQELNVQGIPHIVVADALITPDSSQVQILENSKIEELKNAVVVFDTAVANHRLYDATINIVSRKRFTGEGTYELVTVQDTFAIKFDQFRLEEDEERGLYTKSSGTVEDKDGVIVSPGFTFKGDVFMYAFRKALELKGAVKLNLEKLKERNVWIEYESNDDIAEVVFNFDEARTESGDPLTAGLHFNNGDIYASFITEKRGLDDDDFFIPSGGNLFYDQETGSYNVANQLKVDDPANNYAGSMFSYNEATQDVTFEGNLNFISPYSKGLDFKAAGKGKGNLDSADFVVNTMFTVGLGLPAESLPFMATDLKTIGENVGVRRAHEDRSDLIYKVAEFIGDQATKDWDNSYQTVPIPLVNASTELLKDLVISNVDLKWSKQNKAFYSTGKIGVSNVGITDLNMEMDGFVEIRKTPEGEVVNILLQITDGTWYYFTYDGFSLGTTSSNPAYNASLAGKGKAKSKVGSFKLYNNTIEEVMVWTQNFRKLYLGIDEPYRLLMADESSQTLKKKKTVEGDGF
ncbi:MAG: hypothetical protein HEP71_19045 [Roseivirga sp.]|nr:hypothetical protein [Roseivirga sp.]